MSSRNTPFESPDVKAERKIRVNNMFNPGANTEEDIQEYYAKKEQEERNMAAKKKEGARINAMFNPGTPSNKIWGKLNYPKAHFFIFTKPTTFL